MVIGDGSGDQGRVPRYLGADTRGLGDLLGPRHYHRPRSQGSPRIVFASRLDPDSLSRKLLALIQNMIGGPLLNLKAINGEFLEIRADLPPSRGLRLLGLPPGQLSVRIYPGQPTREWIAHQALLTTFREDKDEQRLTGE